MDNSSICKLNIFISYSHKNMKYKEKLVTSLEALKQSYNIEPWHDGMINAGGNIDENVKKALCKSNVILLLITDNFLASYYCMEVELKKAKRMEEENKCIVIPVMFQESVLANTLSFFQNNRVPEDGKPIATGFKNQSQGCARAVNMIKNMIDSKFPECKKNGVRKKEDVKKEEEVDKTELKRMLLYMELYKEGKMANIPVTQEMINSIPQYHTAINSFRTIMEQSLLNAKKRYSQLCKQYKGCSTIIPDEEKLKHLRLYLMDICAYTKTYITDSAGVKVHFRVSKNDYYVGLIASTADDDMDDLSSDWTTKMTPIKKYKGLIYHSSKLNAPLIKSLNINLNFKGKNDKIWKDYVTFTFPKFHSGITPLISYCISIHTDYYEDKRDMLKILAYLNFGTIVEKYILDYCNICRRIDKTYNLESVISSLK